MRPSRADETTAAITKAAGKMHEFNVAPEHHIQIPAGLDIDKIFLPALATIGDFAASCASDDPLYGLPGARDQNDLRFYANALSAFVDTERAQQLSARVSLLAAGAYYLGGAPGISLVLLRQSRNRADSAFSEIESALTWALNPDLRRSQRGETLLANLCLHVREVVETGEDSTPVVEALRAFRDETYQNGTASDLLLADVFVAVCLARLRHSSASLLPRYSSIGLEPWREYLSRDGALRELWPSQRLLGESGVYRGKSAIVQMPTSAGKSRAIELVIRSSFLSGRASVAVVIAPFRALVQEISSSLSKTFREDGFDVNTPSDAAQADFAWMLPALFGVSPAQPLSRQVIVATPEKFLFMLRQEPGLAGRVGLVIYDEGHQFDTGARGVTYELLLTTIKRAVAAQAQVVLISAVVKDPEHMARWLLPNADGVIADQTPQTERALAFTSWQHELGRLQFVDPVTFEDQFFVPRIIAPNLLELRGRERRQRPFPERDPRSIALYLGCKLVENGAVAIFCGTKAEAIGVVKKALDAFERGAIVPRPADCGDAEEISRIVALYVENFGDSAYLTRAARLGVFAHHGDTPHGLRLVIEHAMRSGAIGLVSCTSTLAQGVNLPIRYLLVSGVWQGGRPIKGKDFHNLIGRAGRAGMHREGTIIFTDPRVYDGRNSSSDRWRWQHVTELLDPAFALPTSSSLLELAQPILNRDRQRMLMSPVDLVRRVVADERGLMKEVAANASALQGERFDLDPMYSDLRSRISAVHAVQSFIMSDGAGLLDPGLTDARELARSTFAYELASDAEKSILDQVFEVIREALLLRIPDDQIRLRYGRTLLGVNQAERVDDWVAENVEPLSNCMTCEGLLSAIWALLVAEVDEKKLSTSSPDGFAEAVAGLWITGSPYSQIVEFARLLDAKYGGDNARRSYSLDEVVSFCEHVLGHSMQLIVSALTESISVRADEIGERASEVGVLAKDLQKRLKYGLADRNQIVFFEGGFAERQTAIYLSTFVRGELRDVAGLKAFLRQHGDFFRERLSSRPGYFREVLDSYVD